MTATMMQPSFTGGEISPSLYGRVDLSKYHTGLKVCRNFIAHRHGGISNRSGTVFVNEVKVSSKAVRLIPFQFNAVQSYILEFGDQYIRIIKDGGLVQWDPADVSAWITATGYTVDDFAKDGSNNIYRCIADHTSSASDEPGTGASWETYWVLDSNYMVSTPYLEADLARINYKQSADVLYLVHPGYEPRKLSRTDHDAWTLSTISFGAGISAPTGVNRSSGSGTTYRMGVTAVSSTGEESLLSSTVTMGATDTISWTAVTGADFYRVYMERNGIYGWVGNASGTSWKNDTYGPDMDYTAPLAQSPFSGGVYPGAVALYKQRLIFARTDTQPQTIWGSQVGNYENFNKSNPVRDDDSFEFTMDSDEVNEILWMVGLRELVIGTTGGEWEMSPGGDGVLSPSSVDLSKQSNWGSSRVTPLVIGNSVIFVQSATIAIRDLSYSLESDGYTGNELSILANHLIRDYTITEWAYARDPDSIIWAIRSDGTLLALTYDKSQQVFGWSRHDTPGGTFESVAVIRDGDGNDQVYFVVNRTVGGNTVRYIEQLSDRLPGRVLEDGIFLDSSLTYSGAAATVISGMDHLEGETINAIADGNVVESLTVSSGSITLPKAASKVHLGIPYTCEMQTLELDGGGDGGTMRNRKRRITEVNIQLENTRYLQAGPDENHIYPMPFRTTEDYGDPTGLFTGMKEINIDPSVSCESAAVYVKHDKPSPITILSIIPRIEVGG